MKQMNFLCGAMLAIAALSACQNECKKQVSDDWSNYHVGYINFVDKAPESKGSAIYHQIITNPEAYITSQAKDVLSTLYFSPADSIVRVDTLHYSPLDIKGISAKDGGNGVVSIFYSTQHVEKSFAMNDTAKVLFETRGVLLHELTHAYQLEPQGIGNYGNSRVFWAFIEGMADAVRIANGGFGEGSRPIGGSYMDGYRTAGYFFVWLRDNKDPDFLKKFNRSTLEVIPWSFEGAIQHVLGKEYHIDELWHEYQVAVGDIEA
ncbi:MAG: basic secretory protein-like protein [Bacteroides sp.]